MTQLGLTLAVMTALLFSAPACGKKGDPFLPREQFDAKVTHLKADLQESSILLEGDVASAGGAEGRVKGSRVFFAEYPAESPPCEGCPVEYRGYRSFGPEVIEGKRFSCRIPELKRNELYFFKVVLVGPGDVQGPFSDALRVNVD